MSMTTNEAEDRAKKIWRAVPGQIRLRPDGGADIDFGDADVHPFGYHRLDENGHAACHHSCKREEESECGGLW